MKKIIYCLSFIILAISSSCRKEEKLNVDLNKLNDQQILNTDLDAWLKTNFLDVYNMDVVYRYNRFYHGDDKDVAAINPAQVQPQMVCVKDGFLEPYRKIAGAAFIKKMTPKEWVLFGSGAYNLSDNSVLAGTASGGRRITLYGVNGFNANDGIEKLRVIHHEFTHVLNQLIQMPPDFQTISKANYNANYTTVSDATALSLGFVSSYAGSQYFEDFAETTAHLLVKGQNWFDNRCDQSSVAGKIALRAKEASIVSYFKNSLGIDFRALQVEVLNVLKNNYGYKEPAKLSDLFNRLIPVTYNSITINLEDPLYTNYGISSDFSMAYNAFKTQLAAANPNFIWHLDKMRLDFLTANTLNVRFYYTGTKTNTTTQNWADYSFSYTSNLTTGEMTFAKVTQGTGSTFNNASNFAAQFANTLQVYLTGKTFIAQLMPADFITYSTGIYGKLTEKDKPTNYFYGALSKEVL